MVKTVYWYVALGTVALACVPTQASQLRGRSLVSVDTDHYRVASFIDEPLDKACYRRMYRGKPCPRGYDWDGVLACWAQCPLEYPVECGAECLPHNRACTKEILDKTGSVVSTTLNGLTAGVFSQLAATGKATTGALRCAHKMIPIVKRLSEFVSTSSSNGGALDPQFQMALHEQDFFTQDLPAVIAVCLGREPPSSAGPSPQITRIMQLVLDKVIASKDKGGNLFSEATFLEFLDAVGFNFSGERKRRLRSAFGWNDAKNAVDAGLSCGRSIKGVVDSIIDIVKSMKTADTSASVQSIRYAVMNSNAYLRDLPDTVVGCVDATGTDSQRLRDQILKAAYAIIDQLLDATVTSSGKPRPLGDFVAYVADLGLDALSSFDPSGLAAMVKEFVQPICGPTIFSHAIDDGPADLALGLRTVETTFAGSSGNWYTTEANPATDTQSTVDVIFRSTDSKDVTVEISSGGNDFDKVKVSAGATVAWSRPLAQLQAKTMYMVRSRAEFWFIKGRGGGSLLAWMPAVPNEGTGVVKLDIQINPPSEREELLSMALHEQAERAEEAHQGETK